MQKAIHKIKTAKTNEVTTEIRRGRRVEQIIFESGYSSVHDFWVYLREFHANIFVSEDTIMNLVKGKGAQINTLIWVAQGLGIPTGFLTNDYIPILDDYLEEIYEMDRDEIEELYDRVRMGECKTGKRYSYMLYLYHMANQFCQRSWKLGNAINAPQAGILTYPDLILYLPLCRLDFMVDVWYRIDGDIPFREDYVMKQFAYLYKKIPDIPAKRFADCQARLLPLIRKRILSSREQEIKSELLAFTKTKEYDQGYCQYEEILSKWQKLLSGDLMNTILKSIFSELYAE